MIRRLLSDPQRLFLLDGFGAYLSAFLLAGFLFRVFPVYMGMPGTVLTLLVVVALALGTFSVSCFFFVRQKRRVLLRIVYTANLLYCALTAFLFIRFFETLSLVGIVYFLLEMAVIAGLAYLEIKASGDDQ